MTHDAYLRQLPADLRSGPLPDRTSTRWRHGDTDVHVERIGDPAAPRQLVLLEGAGHFPVGAPGAHQLVEAIDPAF